MKRTVVKLVKGIEVSFPEKGLESTDLMSSVGLMLGMLYTQDVVVHKQISHEKFKQMVNMFVNTLIDGQKERKVN